MKTKAIIALCATLCLAFFAFALLRRNNATFGTPTIFTSESPISEGIFDKSGKETVMGREIEWHASGYLKFLAWRYKATAKDTATGITGSTSNHKSGEGAVKDAIADCFKNLAARGVLKPGASLVENAVDNNNAEVSVEAGFVGDAVVAPSPSESLASTVAVDTQTTNNENEQTKLGGMFDKSGKETVMGREIEWHASGYLKFLAWRYKATAKDAATGITGSSSNNKSGEGAVKDAIADCFKNLAARGVLKP